MTTDRADHIEAMLARIDEEGRAIDSGGGDAPRRQLLVRELVDLFSGNVAEVARRMGASEDELHAILRNE